MLRTRLQPWSETRTHGENECETVRQCLRGSFTGPQALRLARDLRFEPVAYPSELAFDQWLGLFRHLLASGDGPARSPIVSTPRARRARRDAGLTD